MPEDKSVDKFSYFLNENNELKPGLSDLGILGLGDDYFDTGDLDSFNSHCRTKAIGIHPDKYYMNEVSRGRATCAFQIFNAAKERILANIKLNGRYKNTDSNRLSASFFANINLDPDLNGFVLQRLAYTTAIRFLQNFFKENQKFLWDSIQDADYKNDLIILSAKIDSLLESLELCALIKESLQSEENGHSLAETDEILTPKLSGAVLPLAQKINNLKKKQSLLMPGGTFFQDMIYEFQKDQNENLVFIVYNSTVNDKHDMDYTTNTQRFESIVCFSIKKENISVEKLQFFISELLKPKLFPIFAKSIEQLYDMVFSQISHLKGEEVAPKTLVSSDPTTTLASTIPRLTKGHNDNNSCLKSLTEVLKSTLTHLSSAKQTLLTLKLHSMEVFLSQSCTLDDLSLLERASENVSRHLLKNNHTSEPIVLRALELNSRIKERALKIHFPKPYPKLKYHPLLDIKEEQKADNPAVLLLLANPVQLTGKPQIFVPEATYNETKEEKLQTWIKDPNRFSMTVFTQLHKHIHKLIISKSYPLAELAIHQFLKELPLTASYFESINTLELASDYLEKMRQLFISYAQITKELGIVSLTPTQTAMFLIGLESIQIVFLKPGISFFEDGIECYSGFEAFKSNLYFNPYLYTNDIILDLKIHEILVKPCRRAEFELDLKYLSKYLNKPQNHELKEHLSILYKEQMGKPPQKAKEAKDLLYFDNTEQYWFERDNYKEAIALLHFFKDPVSEDPKLAKERAKVKLFKQAHAMLHGFAKMLDNHTLLEFTQKTTGLDENKKYIKRNKERGDMEGDIDLCISLNINIEKTIAYFKKIKDKHLAKILEDDLRTGRSDKKVNEIYASPNGNPREDRDKKISERAVLYKQIRQLRVSPAMQVKKCIAFFANHLFLVSSQEGLHFPNDIHLIFKRCFFQSGLLVEAINQNLNTLTVFNAFISGAIVQCKQDTNNVFLFYQLQAEVCHYLSKMPLKLNADLHEKLLNLLLVTRKEILKKIEALPVAKLSPMNRYLVIKLKLDLMLQVLSETDKSKPDTQRLILQLFLNLGTAESSVYLESQEERDEHQRIVKSCFMVLKRSRDSIYKWTLGFYADCLSPSNLKSEGKYPYFFGVNEQKEIELLIDLRQGQIQINASYRSFITQSMSGSSLCTEMLAGRTPEFSITVLKDSNNERLYKQYDIPGERFLESLEIEPQALDYVISKESLRNETDYDSVKPKTIYITYDWHDFSANNGYVLKDSYGNVHTGILDISKSYKKDDPEYLRLVLEITSSNGHTPLFKPWIYQKEFCIRQRTQYFEKQFNFIPKLSKVALSYKQSIPNTHCISLKLPEYLYGNDTRYWISLDKTVLMIEFNNKWYVLAPSHSHFQELDDKSNETGYSLCTNQNAPNYAIISQLYTLFSPVENPEFTQILFKEDEKRTYVVAVKINFIRFGLELEGSFDPDKNEWILHLKDKPGSVLVTESFNTEAGIPNRLVFKDETTEKYSVYIPHQSFYLDKEKNDYFSILPQFVFDTQNHCKRKRLDKNRAGYASYAHTESCFKYTMEDEDHLISDSSEGQLYLAYIHFTQLNSDKALKRLKKLRHQGGVTGSYEELGLIFDMLECPIETLSFVAVKMYLLFLCIELFKEDKNFNFPDKSQFGSNSVNSDIALSRYHQLIDFNEGLKDLTLEYLGVYTKKRANIHKELLLSEHDEYQMMLQCQVKTKGNFDLVKRFNELERHQRLKEIQYLQEGISEIKVHIPAEVEHRFLRS